MSGINPNTTLLKTVAKDQLEHAIKISTLTNKVDDLETGIQRILYLLENDDKTGSKGIAEQVRVNTSFRQDLKAKLQF